MSLYNLAGCFFLVGMALLLVAVFGRKKTEEIAGVGFIGMLVLGCAAFLFNGAAKSLFETGPALPEGKVRVLSVGNSINQLLVLGWWDDKFFKTKAVVADIHQHVGGEPPQSSTVVEGEELLSINGELHKLDQAYAKINWHDQP